MKVEKIILENSDILEVADKIKNKILIPKRGQVEEIEAVFDDYNAYVHLEPSMNDNDMYSLGYDKVCIFISFNCLTDSDGTKAEIKCDENIWKEFVKMIEHMLNS